MCSSDLDPLDFRDEGEPLELDCSGEGLERNGKTLITASLQGYRKESKPGLDNATFETSGRESYPHLGCAACPGFGWGFFLLDDKILSFVHVLLLQLHQLALNLLSFHLQGQLVVIVAVI